MPDKKPRTRVPEPAGTAYGAAALPRGKALQSLVAQMRTEIDELRTRVTTLEHLVDGKDGEQAEPPPPRDIPREQAMEEIRSLFSGGRVWYMSDIAERLNLPDELVIDICNELRAKRELRVSADAL